MSMLNYTEIVENAALCSVIFLSKAIRLAMFWQFSGKKCKINDMLKPKLTLCKTGNIAIWSF